VGSRFLGAPRTHLSNVSIRIRARAPSACRGVYVFVAVALSATVATPALAEDQDSRCDACSPPSSDDGVTSVPEATSTVPDVSETDPPRSQGGTVTNFEPEVDRDAAPAGAGSGVGAGSGFASAAGASNQPMVLGLRFPEFLAFGIGGLGAGGAVVTRLAASAPYTDPKLGCNGRCADGAHTLSATSTILAGLAVGAVGTGVVLALSGSTRETKPLAPVLKMSVSPSRAAASASWTF